MLRELRPALVLLVILTIVTGVLFPFAVTGVAKIFFPIQAAGSLIEQDGKIIGSSLIGQNFSEPKYFHGRPSATTATDPNDPDKSVAAPYNAANSGGANLGPTSKALTDRMADDIKALGVDDKTQIPVDLVTSSASGLDPDISPAAAEFQVSRVAKARNLSEQAVRDLVARNTSERTLGILGERRVNVLALNLALDHSH
jgi:K+-transporting ATPase ATPase C chain